MPPHLTEATMPLRQALVRSVHDECGGPQAVRFDPAARAYEAFSLVRAKAARTLLLDPLKATSLTDALGEATSRWAWDRGDRLGIREIGGGVDRLIVYAVRRKSAPTFGYRDFKSVREHARWLEHVATINLNVVLGVPVGCVGSERELHEHRQARRPEGARR